MFRLEEISKKLWLPCPDFYCCFCYYLINSIYQPCIPSCQVFFKVSFVASLSYKYMKIWYNHGQYKANGLGINEISYNIFDLRHVNKVAAHFQKNKKSIYSFKYRNKERGKIFKSEAVFRRTLPNIFGGAFLQKYNG